MLRQIVNSQWFALTDLLLVLLSGAVWMLKPELGFWVILIALLPWVFRLLAGRFPFRRTRYDLLIALFLLTAWLGYWAAYNETIARSKFGFIVLAVLLYYALSAQPQSNLIWVSFSLFGLGIVVSLYYFLTFDFVAAPRKLEIVNRIGQWLMLVRPHTDWSPIHPNYEAGIAAVMLPFGLYPVWMFKKENGQIPLGVAALLAIGLAVAAFALFMTTSRGVVLAILSGVGAWLLERLLGSSRFKHWGRQRTLFSSTLFVYLGAIIVFLYAGPARAPGAVADVSPYGDGSRAELFVSSSQLLADFPITGGGLGAFPGLFSHYILDIPYYYLPNSHNLFLDVAIEQGLIGGLSFLILYIAALWRLSGSLASSREMRFFQWIVLYALIVVMIHGLVDDYFYNGAGSMLALFPIGLAASMSWDEQAHAANFLSLKLAGAMMVILTLTFMANRDLVRSIWFANLGAVQMEKVELTDFPNSGWAGSEIVPDLDGARSTLQTSLQFDPSNQTAHHHLGLIAMLETDFESACRHLEIAHAEAPSHRGILKALGYCYVWLGDFDGAQRLLSTIPEAVDELDAYVWWWGTQGRADLSANAAQMVSKLKLIASSP